MPDAAPATKGHPKGLYLLFSVEMWERMSYYGMRGLLVLYMVGKTNAQNPGFGFAEPRALAIYAWYTGLVYATPLLGGYLADKYLGQRRSVYIGGLLMMLGQFCMAFQARPMFFAALGLLIIGNGFFKPNISTMVGGLYDQGDPRRDGAFTIFYMGINLGAALAGFVCGTIGEKLGYRWGFVSAGVGMMLGVLNFWFMEKKLLPPGIGEKPKRAETKAGDKPPSRKPLTKEERDRIAVILVLAVFVMFFWAAFEQAGGLMNIYTKEKVDRILWGFEIPATWFQTINPIIIFLFAPLFSWFWTYLGRRKIDPPTPIKMCFGLLLLSLGFVLMLHAVNQADAGNSGMAALIWIVGAYFWHTMGELCLSPIGLSLVTKLAPARMVSFLMGAWFGSNFLANLAAGYIGGFSERLGEFELFTAIVLGTAAAGIVLFLLARPLVRMMHLPSDGEPWGWGTLLTCAAIGALVFIGYPRFVASARTAESFLCASEQREAKANLYRLRDKQRTHYNSEADGQQGVPEAQRKKNLTFASDEQLGFCPLPDKIDYSQHVAKNMLEALFAKESEFRKEHKKWATLAELEIDLEQASRDGDYRYAFELGGEEWTASATRKGSGRARDGRDLTGDKWTMDSKGCLTDAPMTNYRYRVLRADKDGFVAEARRIPGRGGLRGDVFTFTDSAANFSVGTVVSSKSHGELTNPTGGCGAHHPTPEAEVSPAASIATSASASPHPR